MMLSTDQFAPQVTELLCSGRPVLAGISGGRDSVALLHLLHGLPGCNPVVCHVHHGLRPEADEECAFVRNLAERMGLPFLTAKADIPAKMAESGLGAEEAARLARQELFGQWATQFPDACVALAHHRNDQQETALLHLCRGASGIRGMAPISVWANGLTVIRPLLNFTRDDITAYLLERGLSWRDDASNDSTEYARNALRHRVIPALNEIFQRDTSLPFERACGLDRLNRAALNQALDALNLTDPQGRLFLPKVMSLPPELKQCAVYRYLRDCSIPDLTEEVVLRVMSILNTGAPSRTSLPGNKLAIRKEKRLFIINL